MSPRTDAADDTPTPAPGTVGINFTCRGFVDIIEGVSLKMRVSKLRPRICAMLKTVLMLEVTPAELRLKTLKLEDDTYPSEADAQDAPGKRTVVTSSIGKEFTNAAASDCWVHLRVEIEDKTKPDAERAPATTERDGDATGATTHFKNGCVKTLAGSKRKLILEDPPEEVEQVHMAFSDFTETQVKRIMLHVTEEEIATVLPEELRQEIRDDYARLTGSSKVPWRENEAARRRYIDAVLTRCVYAVNVANPHKEKLDLEPELAICCAKLDAAGTADWVITRGKRLLVVSEAKQSDINRGQYQLLEMMEALRIQNKMLPEPFHTTQGIITDFQNWLFLDRSPKKLRHRIYGNKTPPGTRFPEDILEACTRFYHLLLNL